MNKSFTTFSGISIYPDPYSVSNLKSTKPLLTKEEQGKILEKVKAEYEANKQKNKRKRKQQ